MTVSAPHAGELSSSEMARYRNDGFLVLPSFFPPSDVAEWAAECDRLQALPGMFHPDNLRTGVLNSERPPDRLDPVIDLSPTLRGLAVSPRVLSVVGQLLGDAAVLFKDKVIFKPAGTRGYAAHQDYAYWQWLPAPPDALLTVLVAIDPATAENGAVEFFPGLHGRLLTPAGSPADVGQEQLVTAGQLASTRPGDVVVFHSLTPHRSGANQTSSVRRQLYLSYAAAAYGDLYRPYYDRLHESLRKAMPGEAQERAYFR